MANPAALSVDEQAAALRRMGVPEPRIRASLGLERQETAPIIGHATVALPVTLVVPWTLLISDDERMGAPQVRRTTAGRYVAQNTLTKEYREAKWELRRRFRNQLGPTLPVTTPVHIAYRFYWPDRRIHDATNYFKMLNDVLSKLVIKDDSQAHRGSWSTAIDPDAPRAELEIRSLTQP